MFDIVLLTFPRCGSNLLTSNLNLKFFKTHDIEASKKDAKLVTIIRNPYDSIVSLSVTATSRYGTFDPSSVLDNITKYLEIYNYLLCQNDVYFISFDQLILNPKKVIKDLHISLGKDYPDVEINPSLSNKNTGFLESSVGEPGYEEAKAFMSMLPPGSKRDFIKCKILYQLALKRTLYTHI